MVHLPPAPVRGRNHRTSPSGAKANVVQLYHVHNTNSFEGITGV
ncbi:MAG: hypothetical protein ACFFD2_19620 [Promethearchaeota archaeon]